MSPIEVEAGSMFSGKSSELKRLIKRLEIAGKTYESDYLVYNFAGDTRYGENILATHNGDQCPAHPISSSEELFFDIFEETRTGEYTLKQNRENLLSIFIDEAQFFDLNLGPILTFIDDFYMENRGERVNIYCAGLDMDFKAEPFGPMPDLMARAHKVNKFTAVCSTCGDVKSWNDCKKHYQIPVTYTKELRGKMETFLKVKSVQYGDLLNLKKEDHGI